MRRGINSNSAISRWLRQIVRRGCLGLCVPEEENWEERKSDVYFWKLKVITSDKCADTFIRRSLRSKERRFLWRPCPSLCPPALSSLSVCDAISTSESFVGFSFFGGARGGGGNCLRSFLGNCCIRMSFVYVVWDTLLESVSDNRHISHIYLTILRRNSALGMSLTIP